MKLITPLYTTKLDERLLVSEGSENNDVCIVAANILRDHKELIEDIIDIHDNDPSLIIKWPCLSLEWVNTVYKVMSIGREGCNYKAEVNVNVWYFRDDIEKGINNQNVRLITNIVSKIFMSHRMLNGLCTSEPCEILESAIQPNAKENHIFDAGVVRIMAPIRVCEMRDNSRGDILNP